MPGINTITADDTLTLYGRVISDFASGDISTIEFPNDITAIKTGKNRNTIYSRNETGLNANLTMRIMRGSSDDKFLQSKMDEINRDFASVTLAMGSFVKRLGDGQGNVFNDVYTLIGGVFTKRIAAKENVESDTDQGVSTYTMMFASGARSLQ